MPLAPGKGNAAEWLTVTQNIHSNLKAHTYPAGPYAPSRCPPRLQSTLPIAPAPHPHTYLQHDAPPVQVQQRAQYGVVSAPAGRPQPLSEATRTARSTAGLSTVSMAAIAPGPGASACLHTAGTAAIRPGRGVPVAAVAGPASPSAAARSCMAALCVAPCNQHGARAVKAAGQQGSFVWLQPWQQLLRCMLLQALLGIGSVHQRRDVREHQPPKGRRPCPCAAGDWAVHGLAAALRGACGTGPWGTSTFGSTHARRVRWRLRAAIARWARPHALVWTEVRRAHTPAVGTRFACAPLVRQMC